MIVADRKASKFASKVFLKLDILEAEFSRASRELVEDASTRVLFEQAQRGSLAL